MIDDDSTHEENLEAQLAAEDSLPQAEIHPTSSPPPEPLKSSEPPGEREPAGEDEIIDDQDFDDDEDSFSLEELGAAYQHIVARSESGEDEDYLRTGEVLQREHLLAWQRRTHVSEAGEEQEDPDDLDSHPAIAPEEDPTTVATPEAIIEAAVFVGQPNGQPITSARLASIMRDMRPEEVDEIIQSLNQSYRECRQGIRIAEDEAGYQMVVAPEVESMRHAFTGKVRETRLAQPAIEVLAMVAYQPGITAAECTDRRGRESGPLLNQMVRRRLVEMRREPAEAERSAGESTSSSAKAAAKKVKMVSRFYPAERLLVLLGLESLEDLPQVEETHLA